MSEKTETVGALIDRVIASHPRTGKAAEAAYFEAVHQELAPAARALEKRVAELENELAESIAVRDRMSELLTKTAEALRGKQPSDVLYDWHDVPARVEAVMTGLVVAMESFVVENEKANLLAELVRSLVETVSMDFESKADFIARVRAVLGSDPAMRTSDLRKERDALRLVCTEAYQMAGALNAPAKVLDNLSAASVGAPLPHETFLPVEAPQIDREKVRDAIAESLGGSIYCCTRQWGAWGVGTMSQNDFVLASEDDGILDELTDAAVSAVEAKSESGSAS